MSSKKDSVNPLYLLVHEINGFIEEIEGSKYLNITLSIKIICRNLEWN